MLDEVKKCQSFSSIYDCSLTYCLTDCDALAAFLAAGSWVLRLHGLEKGLMVRRSAREKGEAWDKQRSMAAGRDGADKTV
jgi:hypothetical protein